MCSITMRIVSAARGTSTSASAKRCSAGGSVSGRWIACSRQKRTLVAVVPSQSAVSASTACPL
jgi:hypothetical protein